MSQLQIAACCALLIVATVSARPQVWDIGFNPNSQNQNNDPNGFLPDDIGALLQVDPNEISTTAAPAAQTTPPSPQYFDCLSRCPVTSEYNPVCGSNQVNYPNLGRLQCAARCGTTVTALRGGTCRPL